tara:strand:- start:36 stop:755 length:720 start_codon:yes stop_codon:yes gene_type:complete
MLKLILPFLIVFLGIAPVMAQTDLSPEQIESLPFSTQGAGTPNTDAIMEEITIHEVEDAEHHGSEAGLPQFNTETFASQLFWLLISFTLLYFFFAKSSLPKLSATIENRLTTIKTDLEQADTLSNEAEQTKISYEQAMSGAHDDARHFIAETVASLRKNSEKDAQDFKTKSDAEVLKLQKQAETAKEKIKGDLAETAYTLTSDIVEKLSGLEIKDKDIQKAVMSYMDDTSTAKKQKKAA